MTAKGARAYVIVPGEEEVGPQKRCTHCGCWWPADPDFFHRHTGRLHPRCKACMVEVRQEQRARRAP